MAWLSCRYGIARIIVGSLMVVLTATLFPELWAEQN